MDELTLLYHIRKALTRKAWEVVLQLELLSLACVITGYLLLLLRLLQGWEGHGHIPLFTVSRFNLRRYSRRSQSLPHSWLGQ